MAYDQYMYPMEQPGYQAPPMPGAFEWLMNNPYVGPGSIPPSNFSLVDQGIPNAIDHIGGVMQDYSQAGQGMAQRMKTMTPDYPMGQGFMPSPEAGPAFDPAQVNPGLSFPQGLPDPGIGYPQQEQFGQQVGVPPGEQLAPNVHGPPGGVPYGPPAPGPGHNPGTSFQPQGGLAGTGGLGPAPSPMQEWMTDYNQQTDDYVKKQQDAAKGAMWIQMGQSLLANIGDPAIALAGMGQAALEYGANEPAMEQYRQGREGERLDSLYKMERIRSSQADPGRAPRATQRIRMADGTYAEEMGVGSGKYLYNSNVYDLEGLNKISLRTSDRAGDRKTNRKRSEQQGIKEASIELTMRQHNVSRERAEKLVDQGLGVEAESPTGQVPVTDPEEGVRPLRSADPAIAMRADEIRELITNDPDPSIQHFAEWDDEDLVEMFDEP